MVLHYCIPLGVCVVDWKFLGHDPPTPLVRPGIKQRSLIECDGDDVPDHLNCCVCIEASSTILSGFVLGEITRVRTDNDSGP